MGLAKHSLNLSRDDEYAVGGTKLLYEHDCIEDERAKGIARQVIGQNTILRLSQKQKYIYNQHIHPLFKTELTYCRCCFETILKGGAHKLIQDRDNEKGYCSEGCWETSQRKGY